MAKLYGEIAKSALLTLDKSFSRALGQPLDSSEVYYSLEAAKTYAASTVAYVGQKIVVIEDGKVTHYSVEDTSGTLKEVGVRPVGDNKSITVSAEGLVSIVGADAADGLTVPRMKSDKSGLEWVALTDANDDTTYEIKALTKTTGEGDAQVTETYGITVKPLFNGEPIVDEETGKEIVTNIPFDVYTKSEIDAKIKDLDDKVDTGNKTVTEYVNEEIGKKIHIRTEVVTEVPTIEDAEEGVIYLVADENSAAGAYLEYILVEKDGQKSVEQIGDTTTDLSNYYNKDEIDDFFEALPKDTNTTYSISTGTTNTKVNVTLTPSEGAAETKEIDAYNTTTIDKMLYEGSYTGKDGEVVSNITTDKDKARLLSSEEIKKLSALVIDEDGTVGISGTVNAQNVTGLAEFINGQVTGDGGLRIEQGAEVNIIEIVKVNGTALEPDAERAVNITVPTKLSQLEDDIAHVSDVVVKATQRNGDGTIVYESKLKATRSAETNVVTLDDSALQDAINVVNDNVVHSISVNKAPVTADSEHHVNITATTGSQNGTIAIAGQDIAVKGLGTAAYRPDTDFKIVQDVVNDVTATETDATTISFIESITQDKNGVITPVKKSYNIQTNILDLIDDNKEAIEHIYKKVGETETGLLVDEVARATGREAELDAAIKAIYNKPDSGDATGILPELAAAVAENTANIATLVGDDTDMSVRDIVKAEVGSAGHLKRVFVSSLEEIGTPKADTIYMVGKNNAVGVVFTSDQAASFPEEGSIETGPSWFDGAKCAVYPVTAGATYTIESIVNDTTGWNKAAFMKPASTNSYSSCNAIEVFDPSAGLTKTAPEEATLLYINYASDAEAPVVREGASNDVYKEYILNDAGELVQIGDTSVNLTGYATEEWVTALVNNTTPPQFTENTLGTIKGATDVLIDDQLAPDRNAVYARESGVGEVRALSTDILVNGTKTLILNGGHAEI